MNLVEAIKYLQDNPDKTLVWEDYELDTVRGVLRCMVPGQQGGWVFTGGIPLKAVWSVQ